MGYYGGGQMTTPISTKDVKRLENKLINLGADFSTVKERRIQFLSINYCSMDQKFMQEYSAYLKIEIQRMQEDNYEKQIRGIK